MDKKVLILITDDEPGLLELFTFVAEREGFEVITATNGNQCIELARSHKPSLILLDLSMPFMDGIETLIKLRQDPETKDLKVVFLSAFNKPEDINDHIDPQYIDEVHKTPFIKKGVSLDEFADEVKQYL